MRNVPRMLEEKRELIAAVMREKVFECTCSLLREEGWRAFTMEKLAARMGVAKGTLYNYFRDKESVILFIRDRVTEHAGQALTCEMEKRTDTLELLRESIAMMLEGLEEYRFLHVPLGEIVLRRLGTDGGRELREGGSAGRHVLAQLIGRGMREGIFRPGDAELTAAMIQSAVAGVDMGRCLDAALGAGTEQMREQLCDLILRGICNDRSKSEEERA